MPAETVHSRSHTRARGPEVYSAREIALAGGVDTRVVKQLVASADIPTVDGELVSHQDALEAVRGLRDGGLKVHPSVARPGVFGGAFLSRNMSDPQSQGLSALMSTALHAAAILLVALLSTVSLTTASDTIGLERPQLARLVFVAEPGPGGGGGGGGAPDAGPSAKSRASRLTDVEQPGA